MAIAESLAALADDPQAVKSFSLRRIQSAGSPLLWEERFCVDLERVFYLRRRSQVDEAGAPIGKWSRPVDFTTLKALAAALQASMVWENAFEHVVAGAERIQWQLDVNGETWSGQLSGQSAALFKLAKLDLTLRRIINHLLHSRQGRALVCEFNIRGGQISLYNPANSPVTVVNPLATAMNHMDFLRVELAKPTVAAKGQTGLGWQFKPIRMPLPDVIPVPFEQTFIQIGADDRIHFPMKCPVSGYHQHIVRAVYSNYMDMPEDESSELVRGRAYSVEQQIP